MKIQLRISIVFLVMFISFCFAYDTKAAGPTIINEDIVSETHWGAEGGPYIIYKRIKVNAPLIIEPGVVVKFKDGLDINLLINSDFSAIGTEDKRIVFTSTCDQTISETKEYCSSRWVSRGDWVGINIFDNLNKIEFKNVIISYAISGISYKKTIIGSTPNALIVKNSEIRNCSSSGIILGNVFATIEYNKIHDNSYGIFFEGEGYPNPRIKNNAIYNNRTAGLSTLYYPNTPVDARYNWWGDASGPKYYDAYHPERSNPDGIGNKIVGQKVEFDPWLGKDPTIEDPGCQENCYSNVMFLPGIKASRLYKTGSLGTEDRLWVPNFFGSDMEDLALDDNGSSINNVYTKDVLDEVAIPTVGGNIYKSFLQKLSDLKEQKVINDYESFAYDWRQDVEDVAQNGTSYKGEVKSAVDDLVKLAENSKSEKVTIVAHSNGGLLAKAIMIELEKKGLANKVDKIIMVGTPQMGTPLSMLSLLYGYDESALLGTLISREDARVLAENMPGAYGLLPSSEYFSRSENPFITFASENTRYKKFSDAYGQHISNPQEFFDFLAGTEGRTNPDSDEVEKENNLNEKLLAQANEMHARLDNWTPPEGIKVIQIAGWGLDTVSGVKYSEKEKYNCYMADSKIPSCIGMGEYEPIYEPEFTVDGDEVVVTPSALMMSGSENVEKYWVDLKSNNRFISINRKHKDLAEINSVLLFIDNVIKNDYQVLPEFIEKERPSNYENSKPELRMSLYSPLDIHLYDEKGNHTGPRKITVDGHEKTVFETRIPNSYYYQYGDRKYVGFPEGQDMHISMEGYAIGTYTLKLDEVQVTDDGEKILSNVEFSNLPTTENAKVDFDIPSNGLTEMTKLKADLDGDGKNEYELDGKEGEKIELPITLEMISANIDHLAKLGYIKNEKTKDFLQVKLKELMHIENMVKKMDKKENDNPAENQLELFDKKVTDLIGFIEGKLDDDMSKIAQDILIKDLKSVKIK